MRTQTVFAVVLGGLATAAFAQVASAPVERKALANAPSSDEAVPAANRVAPANTAAPSDEAVPAPPPNGVAPIEPKL